MKWLFIVMILVNAGFGVWAANREAPQEQSPNAAETLPGHINRLLLLSELDEKPLRERSPAVATRDVDETGQLNADILSPGQSEEGTPAKICLSVGPLASLEDVDRIGGWLTSRGGVSTLREGERREVSRFWVYFPPFQNRDAAITRVQQLQEAQIDDIYVIYRGDMANAVSLGLYSRRESLERRLSELRSKGYEPSIERRYETKKSSWFDVSFPPGISFSREHFVTAFPSVEANESSCS